MSALRMVLLLMLLVLLGTSGRTKTRGTAGVNSDRARRAGQKPLGTPVSNRPDPLAPQRVHERQVINRS